MNATQEMVQHPITHKVSARDDHPKGNGQVCWFASINGGDSYFGVKEEPTAGSCLEMRKNFLPMSLAWPRGFRLCGLTPVTEPEEVA